MFTEWELGQVDEALAAAVGRVEGQRLHHVVSFESCLLHSRLHHRHGLDAGLRIKVAVHADDLSTWGGHEGNGRVSRKGTTAGKSARLFVEEIVLAKT